MTNVYRRLQIAITLCSFTLGQLVTGRQKSSKSAFYVRNLQRTTDDILTISAVHSSISASVRFSDQKC